MIRGLSGVEIVTSDGSTAAVSVRWQTTAYLGAVVRVSYITGVTTCAEVVEDERYRK